MFELNPYRPSRRAVAYNPFQEIEAFEKRFFNAPFASFWGSSDIAEFKTDISDQEDHYLLEADLPGFEKKDIHLEMSENILTIDAERHSEHDAQEQKNNYVRIERSYGKYRRQFDISAIDADQIKARYDNGVLTVTLPKKQEMPPETRRLEIE